MKNASILLIIIIALIGGFVAGYLIFSPSSQVDQIVGDDMDEHGCIGSAGYRWCEAKQECLRLWEVKCDENQMHETIQALGDDLVNNTSIESLRFNEAKFDWLAENEIIEVNGLTVVFENAPGGLYHEIGDYLKSVGFESDIYNMRDGTITGGEGYRNGLTVCQLSIELTPVDEANLDGPVRLSLSCGLLDNSPANE